MDRNQHIGRDASRCSILPIPPPAGRMKTLLRGIAHPDPGPLRLFASDILASDTDIPARLQWSLPFEVASRGGPRCDGAARKRWGVSVSGVGIRDMVY
ncbi:hypothetical protein CPLU01_03015 [Colletotrichum plurivorum]|uniref:Uncharacterized protein n=1 Tax=Colletotrichum plurivorum TaxID=2175906 RepID=A0A8H6NM20_9PEZI|nr:hypothetical protein CPLU01_03015 [Colletotrichum plurivorum]